MKKLFFFFIFLVSSFLTTAQTYKYIGVKDGLSNRRVYAIQKGPKGYMWFLTHDGIDRYNGKEFKHYKLMDGEEEINSMMNLNWLYTDSQGRLWEIGKHGRVFCYESKHDRFQLIYKLPKSETQGLHIPVSYGFVDDNSTIWLCNQKNIYLHDSNTKETVIIRNEINESITDIEQIDTSHFFIGTDVGVHYAELKNNVLSLNPCEKLDTLRLQINELFFHKSSRKVFIGTFQRGIYVYDLNLHKAFHIKSGLVDVSINRICTFGDKEILIATDGAGVYKMNVDTYQSEPYIVADFNRYNAMNGNTIYDIYVDDDQRIWMANYPIGITVRNNKYSDYEWIKHSVGNRQSLINDQVNAIIEDSEGDLWYATNNGISLYNERTGQWQSFLSVFNENHKNQNHTFISLCEVSPGIIWAGGYSSGIYQIDKKKGTVSFFTPALFGGTNIRPDKYIRSIVKDSEGYIWSGGYYNLKKIDFIHKKINFISGLDGITEIKEKDREYMWIGTTNGLYLLEKATGKHQYITMPVESSYICSLYQAPGGLLYIGTNNSGLLIYDPVQKSFEHYHKDNCALISNNIYTILSDGKDDILLSTEHGLSGFYPKEKVFHNWTKEQGLHSDHFNASSGTLRKNGNVIFGSTDGAIEFPRDMAMPREYDSRMIFSDLRVFYQTVYPKDEGSPLVLDIDETKSLRLKYNQNIFSLQVSSINYDYPSLILYSWKLEGFYDGWSRPGEENVIRFTNLNPGHYTLRVRAISNEDRRIVLEERSMDIIIEQPAWLSIWALLLYALILIAIAGIALRIIVLRKQRKISDDKIRFFVNTAHDIRTPLTLIKAPLEELSDRETLSKDGIDNLNTALRNVNALLRLTTNLINFERADTYTNNFHVSEYELGAYISETINTFRPYASVKHINLTYESNFRYLNVWLDKDKMDSILKNIVSNALKYTPDGGSVHVYAYEAEDTWNIEVSDTGIGIPLAEQKKLFKMHFRGSNAINSKVTGSGIGLLLVWKLVHIHKGKLSFTSTEGKGSCIKVSFPKGEKRYRKAIRRPDFIKEKAQEKSYVPGNFKERCAGHSHHRNRSHRGLRTCPAANPARRQSPEDTGGRGQRRAEGVPAPYPGGELSCAGMLQRQIGALHRERVFPRPHYFGHHDARNAGRRTMPGGKERYCYLAYSRYPAHCPQHGQKHHRRLADRSGRICREAVQHRNTARHHCQPANQPCPAAPQIRQPGFERRLPQCGVYQLLDGFGLEVHRQYQEECGGEYGQSGLHYRRTLYPAQHEPHQLLQQAESADRPVSGGLCAANPTETCHATVERAEVHYHRGCRNDRVQRCEIFP